jgi:ubiquinone/menaquinone biosynthesis C-methylase UbiE
MAERGDLGGAQAVSYVERNRRVWTEKGVGDAESARRHWSQEPSWGIWNIPEAELRALPDVRGKDVVDLGCGTGYFSAWLARMGARPVGVDISEVRLETARSLQQEFELDFPLLCANAEDVPLPDSSFDVGLSEYGASTWCDPSRWIPEAARLLRPGGDLVFLRNSTLIVLCFPEEDAPALTELQRDYFGLHRVEFPLIDDSVSFQLGYGDWIRLLRANGFEVLDLIEIQAPDDAEAIRHNMVTADWARRWPSEEIWKAQKRG